MSTSRMGVTAVVSGMVVVLLLGFVTLTGLSASLAWSQSGGYGGGPGICPTATATAATASPTPGSSVTATPSPTGTASDCVPASKIGAQVVALAKAMADALYVNPACGGHIRYPDCYYTWYKAPGSTYPPGLPTFPQAVIDYGERVCPGCSAWANGTYQCVSFVRGAYSQVYPMRLTANAFDLWATYAGQPGWQEIPSAAAPPGQRGLPMPGDVMIFRDTSIGHAAIVMSVRLPTSTTEGAITFSNANSVSPYTTMPLLPDLSVDTSNWPGYVVWGYIRPAGSASASAAGVSRPFSAEGPIAWKKGDRNMQLKTLVTAALLHPAQFATLIQTAWKTALVLGSIAGFFTNLYNDLTAFALAMATFFFAWAALLYMTANQNENHRVQARSNLYIALGGLALALLAQTISGLVSGAAQGQ